MTAKILVVDDVPFNAGLLAADACLHEAKEAGRNRVIVEGQPPVTSRP